jgi:thymidylate synthase
MQEYLDLVDHVMTHGMLKENRTGVDTLSVFGYFYKIDIENEFPLLTTKKMSGGVWNSLVHEVLWYLSGVHHIKEFRKLSPIWNAWADADDNLETAYGRYWRRFPFPDVADRLPGEPWPDAEAMRKYVREETRENGRIALCFDQIAFILDTLLHDPKSRRMVLTAWHPANAAISRLPPCHYTAAFNVTGDGRLNCHLTQRSGDVGLGIPFNIASYSILTYILAKATGHTPGCFAHTIVDAHIYCGDGEDDPLSHTRALRTQLTRTPMAPPTLTLAGEPQERTLEAALAYVAGLKFEDIQLHDYQSHGSLKMKVAP